MGVDQGGGIWNAMWYWAEYIHSLPVDQIAFPACPVKYMYNPVKNIKANTSIGTLNMLGSR